MAMIGLIERPATASSTAETDEELGPVLWVHGYTMNSRIWEEVWDLYPTRAHLGIDLPFHGTAADIAAESRAEVVAEIHEVARERGARHAVGLSAGTIFLFESLLSPDCSFDKIVLVAPSAAGMDDADGANARYRQLMLMKQFGVDGDALTDAWMTSPPAIFEGLRSVGNDTRLRTMRQIVSSHRWNELDRGGVMSWTTPPQELGDLATSNVEIMSIVGSDDMPPYPRLADSIRRIAPNSTVEVLDGLGHLPILEAPARVVPIVARFLAHDCPSLVRI